MSDTTLFASDFLYWLIFRSFLFSLSDLLNCNLLAVDILVVVYWYQWCYSRNSVCYIIHDQVKHGICVVWPLYFANWCWRNQCGCFCSPDDFTDLIFSDGLNQSSFVSWFSFSKDLCPMNSSSFFFFLEMILSCWDSVSCDKLFISQNVRSFLISKSRVLQTFLVLNWLSKHDTYIFWLISTFPCVSVFLILFHVLLFIMVLRFHPILQGIYLNWCLEWHIARQHFCLLDIIMTGW